MENQITGTTCEGGRLDTFAAALANVTRSRAASLIKDGMVEVNGKAQTKPGFDLRVGDSVSVTVPEARPTVNLPQDLPIEILYEDDDLAVVVKPAGMVVHPAAGNEDGTLVNALLYRLTNLSGIGGEARPGIVHRLDKDTSGLLLVAKTDRAHLALSAMLKDRQMEKHYQALVEGTLKEESGVVDAPIARSKQDRKKMAIDPEGRPARTEWRVVERLKGATLLDVHLITGRTHQIRVHMSSLHHPVAGDVIYGQKNGVKVPRLMLHAFSLRFVHPITGQEMSFEAPLPPAFEEGLRKLR